MAKTKLEPVRIKGQHPSQPTPAKQLPSADQVHQTLWPRAFHSGGQLKAHSHHGRAQRPPAPESPRGEQVQRPRSTPRANYAAREHGINFNNSRGGKEG